MGVIFEGVDVHCANQSLNKRTVTERLEGADQSLHSRSHFYSIVLLVSQQGSRSSFSMSSFSLVRLFYVLLLLAFWEKTFCDIAYYDLLMRECN